MHSQAVDYRAVGPSFPAGTAAAGRRYARSWRSNTTTATRPIAPRASRSARPEPAHRFLQAGFGIHAQQPTTDETATRVDQEEQTIAT